MDHERNTQSGNHYPNDYDTPSSGNGYYYSRNHYANAEEGTGYHTGRYDRADYSYIPKEPVRKTKSSTTGGFIKKALAVIVLGAFLGISAGVSFYFVNLATGVMDSVKQAEPEVEVEAEEKNESAAVVKELLGKANSAG